MSFSENRFPLFRDNAPLTLEKEIARRHTKGLGSAFTRPNQRQSRERDMAFARLLVLVFATALFALTLISFDFPSEVVLQFFAFLARHPGGRAQWILLVDFRWHLARMFAPRLFCLCDIHRA